MNSINKSNGRWLKAELHSHCRLDPVDYRICRFTPERLISESAKLGYEVLAITCHDIDIWTQDLCEYAESLGINLIPGMEVTIEDAGHALVYNFHTGSENLNSFAKIRAHSREDTLVIAPHTFFPGPKCIKSSIAENIDIFDAIEYSGFRVPGINFNRRAQLLATEKRKPLVGNGDIHYLWQLGRTFSWIYSEPDAHSIIKAIKQGHVRMETSSLSYFEAAGWWITSYWRSVFTVNPTSERESISPFISDST